MLACSLRAAARAAPLKRALVTKRLAAAASPRRTMAAATAAAAPSVKQVCLRCLLPLLLAATAAAAAAPLSCPIGTVAQACPAAPTAQQVRPGGGRAARDARQAAATAGMGRALP